MWTPGPPVVWTLRFHGVITVVSDLVAAAVAYWVFLAWPSLTPCHRSLWESECLGILKFPIEFTLVCFASTITFVVNLVLARRLTKRRHSSNYRLERP